MRQQCWHRVGGDHEVEDLFDVTVNRRQWARVQLVACASSPKAYPVVVCDVEETNSVFQTVKVKFSRGRVGLRQFDASVRNIRATGGHSPDEFAHATFIFYLHPSHKLLLFFWIGRTHCCIEFLNPGRVRREGSGPVLGQRDFL